MKKTLTPGVVLLVCSRTRQDEWFLSVPLFCLSRQFTHKCGCQVCQAISLSKGRWAPSGEKIFLHLAWPREDYTFFALTVRLKQIWTIMCWRLVLRTGRLCFLPYSSLVCTLWFVLLSIGILIKIWKRWRLGCSSVCKYYKFLETGLCCLLHIKTLWIQGNMERQELYCTGSM